MIARRPRIALQFAGVFTMLMLVAYGGYKVLEDPQNQIWGTTVTSGPADQKVVALTFDDGPNPPYTDAILDELHARDVKATFFVVGRAAKAHPGELRRMAQEGHAIGNHTWDHPHLLMQTTRQIREELARTDEAIFRATGQRPRLMRPPFGARDFAVLSAARRDGYSVVMWSVPLPNDWEQPGDATIAARVLKNVKDGSIIVLHDGNRGLLCTAKSAQACDRSQDVGATRMIVTELRAQGFRFVTIPELMALHRAVPPLTHTAPHRT